MKTWPLALAVLALSALTSGNAQAQVRQGDFRLFFDVGLISHTMSRVKAHTPVGDFKDKANVFTIGPGFISPSYGLGIAYAASRHVLPGLYLAYNRAKLTGEEEFAGQSKDYRERALSQLELRPNLELTMLPGSRFVPYGLLGLSYIRRTVIHDNGDTDLTGSGIGPVVGIGAHAFAAKSASFDFGLSFRALFVDDDGKERSLRVRGLDDVKQREYAILFTLGASLWL